MALTIREKKLAVLWLADRAVVNYLVNEFCPEHKDKLAARAAITVDKVMEEFSADEQAEFKTIDLQIPKV